MRAVRYHIIIDLEDVSEDILKDKEGLKNFLLELTSHIHMKALSSPLVVEGIPDNPGLSGFVIIDYSHISVHTFTDFNEALIDIFSCKMYDQNLAVNEALEYFKAERAKAKIQQVSWVEEAPQK